jgi:nucleotide-binding universal stress UspA family protein
MYDKILIGLDDSDNSRRAAKRLIELQKKFNSEIIAFHSVLHHLSEINPSYLGGGGGSVISLQIHEDYVNRGRKVLKEAEELFKESGIDIETRLIYDIPPEDYIEKIVEEENINLVVLGCKGSHSKLKRTFVGTVPDKVVNTAGCDVLIVR